MNKPIALASVLLACSIAHAQGTCTGSIAGTIGLAIPDGKGFKDVEPLSAPLAFDAAECQCGSSQPPANDIQAAIKLTSALPIGMQGTAEVWVGTGCDNYTIRTTVGSTACEKIATVDIKEFTTASTAGGTIYVPIPAQSLFSPITHGCAQALAQNQIYVFLYTDPMSPFASCTLALDESGQPPDGATNVQVVSGEGDVVDVSWTLPPVGGFAPFNYQVMCSRATSPAGSDTIAFASCTNGVLARIGATSSGDWVPCTGALASNQTSVRIHGVAPGTKLQVMGIDQYGNAEPSAAVTAPALPWTASPATNTISAEHGCSFGGDAPAAPFGVLFLAVLFLAAALRRTS